MLAKTVTTLDVISGGRAVLGLGAGWTAAEHAAYGLPFPAVSERQDRLEEAAQADLLMAIGMISGLLARSPAADRRATAERACLRRRGIQGRPILEQAPEEPDARAARGYLFVKVQLNNRRPWARD